MKKRFNYKYVLIGVGVLGCLYYAYIYVVSGWSALYSADTISFQEIPEEYEYCHISARQTSNYPITDEEGNKVFTNRGLNGILPVSHLVLVSINEDRQSITYRKWSFLLPLGTFEFSCDTSTKP